MAALLSYPSRTHATIADLDAAPRVETKHLSEAVQYRSLDRSYWA